jgi:hypothetical protein
MFTGHTAFCTGPTSLTTQPPYVWAAGLKGLFEGEVFSRSFSPLLGIGCLSPRTVAQALSDKEGQRAFFQPKDPEVAQVVEVRLATLYIYVFFALQSRRHPPCLPLYPGA